MKRNYVPDKPYKIKYPLTYRYCIACKNEFRREKGYRFMYYSPGLGMYEVWVCLNCVPNEADACKMAYKYIHESEYNCCADLDRYIEFLGR